MIFHVDEELAKLECISVFVFVTHETKCKQLVSALWIDPIESQRKHPKATLLSFFVAWADQESVSINQILLFHQACTKDDAFEHFSLRTGLVAAKVLFGQVFLQVLQQLVRVFFFGCIIDTLEQSFFFVDEPGLLDLPSLWLLNCQELSFAFFLSFSCLNLLRATLVYIFLENGGASAYFCFIMIV